MNPSFPPFQQRSRRRRRGIALISVLAMVVLLTALVVTFMLRAGNERQATGFYKAESGAHALADTVVNLVQAQVNEATGKGVGYCWASQPGMIRTYNSSGALVNLYRLYSSTSLTTTNIADLANIDMPPSPSGGSGWPTLPALWVDLNAPVNNDPLQAQVNTHFPILDPRDPANLNNILSAGGTKLDGFLLTSATPVNTGSTTPIDVKLNYNPAPMPVRWLYVLQDGSVTAPDASSSGTLLTFTGTIKPTAVNPIVGRIAFWTDDETCKINVNTAAGDGLITTADDPTNIADATFWDTPRFESSDDVTMAVNQPVNGEYQRYPGHPSTVALMNTLTVLGFPVSSTSETISAEVTSGDSSNFYNLLPRYAFGGSEGATVTTGTSSSIVTGSSIAVASNRLFPSVGEMLFNPNRTASILNSGADPRQRVEAARFFLTAHSRAPELNLFGLPRVTVWPITDPVNVPPTAGTTTATDRLIAFDSIVGGAPYYFSRTSTTNLSITGSATTYIDEAITRNQTILSYLNVLGNNAFPGYSNGGANVSLAAKYGTWGLEQILTEMFDYTRITNISDRGDSNGVDSGIYGLCWSPGGWDEWGSWHVVPTQIPSTSSKGVTLQWGTQGIGMFPVLTEVALQFVGNGVGVMTHAPGPPTTTVVSPTVGVPVHPNTMAYYYASGTTSANRYPYMNPTAFDVSGSSSPTSGQINSTTYPNTIGVQAFLLLNFLYPAQWRESEYPGISVEVDFPQLPLQAPLSLNGTNLNFPSMGREYIMWRGNQGGLGNDMNIGSMPWHFIATSMPGTLMRYIAPSTSFSATYYPFFSGIIPVSYDPWASPTPITKMILSGAPITIKVYDYTGVNVVQTYNVQFPSGNPGGTIPAPVPKLTVNAASPSVFIQPWSTPVIGTGAWPVYTTSGANDTYDTDRWTSSAFSNPGLSADQVASIYFSSQDSIQSMVLSPAWSDARLLNAYGSVPVTAYTAHPEWGIQQLAQNMDYGCYCRFPGVLQSDQGFLVKGANYSNGQLSSLGTYMRYPFVPPASSINTNIVVGVGGSSHGVVTNSGAPGDWDNGIGWYPDGPYINKPDEGAFPLSGQTPYFQGGNGSNTDPVTFFSANRQIPSPAMFGSLPTGVPNPANLGTYPPEPWQTLLFRPGPGAAGLGTPHPGEAGYARNGAALAGAPADKMFLDLFWMPVAEPYAISEPFSSAGKVNMNYQIEPFTYITRSTALRAALATERIAKAPASDAGLYKIASDSGVTTHGTGRLPLDLDQTTTQFDARFNGTLPSGAAADIFRSTADICDIFLVPKGYTYGTGSTNFPQLWYDISSDANADFAMVGDNVRERPYADLYGKLTTKSNTFTIYYRVQTLKSPSTVAVGTWDETQGAITGEYRGSTTLERFLDPNEQTSGGALSIPDYAATMATSGTLPATNLESYYQWRIVENRQFTP